MTKRDVAAEAFCVPVTPYVEGKRVTKTSSLADGRGRAMHVILEGEVERVTADGARSTLKAGDFFGEDWLLSDSARAEMALDDGAAGRALRREAGSTYVASSSYQPVTLEITRVTLRSLWDVDFDDHLRSQHDQKTRDGRGSSDSEPSARVPRRRARRRRRRSRRRRQRAPWLNRKGWRRRRRRSATV